jgi:hypothetical protein
VRLMMNQKYPQQQDSFENIEGIVKKAVKQTAKAVGGAVKAIAGDAVTQITGNYPEEEQAEQGQSQTQQSQKPDPTLTPGQQQTIAQQNQMNLDQTRQNIQKLNADLQRIRQERKQKEQESIKAKEQEKKQKVVSEEKKKEEVPVWKQMLGGKKGTRESSLRSAG